MQFLPPATDGHWIVHPDPAPGYREGLFVHHFDLPAAVDPYPVRIAARECEVSVNGQALPKASVPNWKSPVAYDLGPTLRAGPNEYRIRVSTPVPPPALLVEGPPLIRSDERWTVRVPRESDAETQAAIAYRGEAFLSDRPNFLRASPHFRAWAAAFVVYCLFIVYALIPRRAVATAGSPERGRQAGRALCLALFAVVAFIQLRNAWVYPPDRGFDAAAHGDYVRYVATHWRVPYANEGWEMSQPPLYYALGAAIYTLSGGADRAAVALKAVQFLSPVTALATIGLGWWMLRFCFPGRTRMRVLGFTVVAILPVMLYLSPQVSNEPLAAFVIGAAMCLAMSQIARRDVRWRDAVVVGIGCGLGLLSKYTGAFVFAAVLAVAGLRVLSGAREGGPGRSRRLGWAVVLTATTLALSGWLYARNVTKFGTPFIGAWDRRSGFNIVQPPGYRMAAFYTRFGSVFWQDISHSRDTSFWDGIYGSTWADSHWMFLRRNAEESETLSDVVIWLALLPTVAIVFGFGQALWHLLRREWNHPYFVLVVATVLTGYALLSFTLEHPFYSTLKAHWALSLTPCVGVFAALGLETMCQRLGRLRWVLYANLASLSGLVLYLFWYRGA